MSDIKESFLNKVDELREEKMTNRQKKKDWEEKKGLSLYYQSKGEIDPIRTKSVAKYYKARDRAIARRGSPTPVTKE